MKVERCPDPVGAEQPTVMTILASSMIFSIRDELKKELLARGFTIAPPSPTDPTEGFVSPKDTMVLGDAYATALDLAELLDQMVSRREKLFRSADVVGPDIAKQGYDDVVFVIDAIKAVIARLSLV